MPSNCPLRILVPSNINLKTPKELVNRLKKLIEQKEAKLNQIEILKSKIAEYEKKNTRMEQFRLENLQCESFFMGCQMTRNRPNGEIQITGFGPHTSNHLSPPCGLASKDKQNS